MSRNDDRAAALQLAPVSRETLERLDAYVALLDKWRLVVNLISERSFKSVWSRHVADSAQLLALAPKARIWVDMGSGAGFPGMVIAIQLADCAAARVHLVESDQRKCAFLREAARATSTPAIIHNSRVEDAAMAIPQPVDAVTARALAPLPRLIAFATLWLDNGAVGIFPRGRSGENFTDFPHYPDYRFSLIESHVDRSARIVIVRRAVLRPGGPGRAET
jgi:16S rRNA (guanine527-N7)-methyltransferase